MFLMSCLLNLASTLRLLISWLRLLDTRDKCYVPSSVLNCQRLILGELLSSQLARAVGCLMISRKNGLLGLTCLLNFELCGITHFLQVPFCVFSSLHVVQLAMIVSSECITLSCLRVRSLLAEYVALDKCSRRLVLLLDDTSLLHLLKQTCLLLLLLLFLYPLKI